MRPRGAVARLAYTGPVDVALLGIVILWSLNFSATKYLMGHGFQPIVYSFARYIAAALLVVAIALRREGSLWMARRDLLTLLAAGAIGTLLNQVSFVYAIRLAGVTTTALLLGTIPVVTALVAALLRIERLTRRAAVAGVISFGGVALVILGSGGSVSGSLAGEVLARCVALTWSIYTTLLKPLTSRYSSLRIYAIVLLEGAVLLGGAGAKQLATQDWPGGAWVWIIIAASTIGPLVIGNIFWVSCVGKVGPSRAALFANLQPPFATLFAVLLVAESVGWVQVGGGALIGVSIAVGRHRARSAGHSRKGHIVRALRGMAVRSRRR